MSLHRLFACGVAVSALCSGQVLAQQANDGLRLRPLLGIGYSWGGDNLQNVTLVPEGTSIEYDERVKAGSGLDLRAGLELAFGRSPFSVQLAVAYQGDGVSGLDNEAVEFRRIPVEVMGHWRMGPQWRLGFGVRKAGYASLRYNRGACTKLLSDGEDPCSGDVRFRSNVGLILESEYLLTPDWGLRARYVVETYRPTSAKFGEDIPVDKTTKIRGDHFGILSVWYLR